jgi:hypothetical protein
MAAMKPIPFEVLLIIYVFAVLIGYGKGRYWLRGAGWSIKEKRLALGLILGVFLGVTALNAFYNHRFGFPQF